MRWQKKPPIIAIAFSCCYFLAFPFHVKDVPQKQVSNFNTTRKSILKALPHFAFRFTDNRIIPRFHREGIQAGRPLVGGLLESTFSAG